MIRLKGDKMEYKPGNTPEEYIANIEAMWAALRAENTELKRDLKDCRNELCLRCGDYKQRHLGACDGCRWRADNG